MVRSLAVLVLEPQPPQEHAPIAFPVRPLCHVHVGVRVHLAEVDADGLIDAAVEA